MSFEAIAWRFHEEGSNPVIVTKQNDGYIVNSLGLHLTVDGRWVTRQEYIDDEAANNCYFPCFGDAVKALNRHPLDPRSDSQDPTIS